MSNKNFLFFDVETTGFTKYKAEDGTCLGNHDRLTQLAFILTDSEGNSLEEYKTYVKPNNWFVPKEDFFIENGMSTELCEKEGIQLFDALRVLQEALKQTKVKVAHNISFDNRIILAELRRAKITHELFQFKKGICTMNNSREYVGAKNKKGHLKQPNLQELHECLFNKKFDGAHDALSDVIAAKDCFFELDRLGVINKN